MARVSSYHSSALSHQADTTPADPAAKVVSTKKFELSHKSDRDSLSLSPE